MRKISSAQFHHHKEVNGSQKQKSIWQLDEERGLWDGVREAVLREHMPGKKRRHGTFKEVQNIWCDQKAEKTGER